MSLLPTGLKELSNTKKMSKIKWLSLNEEDLWEERLFLFGIASLWIFFRHTIHLASFSYFPIIYEIFNIGDAGVDIFLFLSGYGLYYSYKKSSVYSFYIKRFLRIIPTYFFFYILYLALHGRGNFGLFSFLETMYYEYWYILFILILYCVYPAIYQCIKWGGHFSFWASFTLSLLYIIFDYVHMGGSHMTVYVSRIPVFFIGVLFADKGAVKGSFLNNSYLLTSCLIIGIGAMFLIPMEYKCFRRLLYLPLVLGLIPLICGVAHVIPSLIKKGVNYIGKISLEFYLLHCVFMIAFIDLFQKMYNSQIMTIVTLLGMTIVVAFVFQVIIIPITNYTSKLLIKDL